MFLRAGLGRAADRHRPRARASCSRRWPRRSSAAWSASPTIAVAAIGIGMVDQAMTFQPGNRAGVQRRGAVPHRAGGAARDPAAPAGHASRRVDVVDLAGGARGAAGPPRARPAPGGPLVALRRARSRSLAFLLALPLWLDGARSQPRRRDRASSGSSASRSWCSPGWAGQVSLGQMAFVGHRRGRRRRHHRQLGLGPRHRAARRRHRRRARRRSIIGYPAMRRGGLTLAVITLAFALFVSSYLLNQEFFGDWLPAAASSAPTSSASSTSAARPAYYYLLLVALAHAIVIVARHPAQPHRARARSRSARTSAPPARTASAPPARRLAGFAISGFMAAFAGVLFVHHQSGLQVGFGARSCPSESLKVFSMVVIGGLGSMPGALARASIYVRGAQYFLPRQWQFLATGGRPAARADDLPRRHRQHALPTSATRTCAGSREAAQPRSCPSLLADAQGRARNPIVIPAVEAAASCESNAAVEEAPMPEHRRDPAATHVARLDVHRPGEALFPLVVLFGLNAVDEVDRRRSASCSPNIRDHFGLDNARVSSLIVALALVLGLLLALPFGFAADRMTAPASMIGGAIAHRRVLDAHRHRRRRRWCSSSPAPARASGERGERPDPQLAARRLLRHPDPAEGVLRPPRRELRSAQCLGPLARRAPRRLVRLAGAVHRLRRPDADLRGPRAAACASRSAATSSAGRWAPSADTVATEESPRRRTPSRGASCWSVGTLRRIFYALPFLAVAFVGLRDPRLAVLRQVFDLNEIERGVVAACVEPAQIVGFIIGIPIATQLLARDPGSSSSSSPRSTVVVTVAWIGFALGPEPRRRHRHERSSSRRRSACSRPGSSPRCHWRSRRRCGRSGSRWPRSGSSPAWSCCRSSAGSPTSTASAPRLLLMSPGVPRSAALVLASAGNAVEGRHRAGVDDRRRAVGGRSTNGRQGASSCCSCGASTSTTTRCRCCSTSTSRSTRARSSRCSAPTAPASRRCCKAISGLVEASGGAIIFDGRDITYTPPDEIAGRGVVQVPGGQGVFPTLTVAENLRLAGWLHRAEAAELRAATDRVLDFFPVLRERLDEPAGNLSGGEQQMLTLGMAFIAQPRLLMIDELSLGLAPMIVDQLLDIVQAIREQGTTIILVEQSVNVALTVAETAYFMEKGEIRFHGPTAELLDRPDVLRSVFLEGAAAAGDGAAAVRATNGATNGEQARAPVATNGDGSRRAPARGARRLEALRRHQRRRRRVVRRSHAGEILGFIGPNGAGKTTLFDVISGFHAGRRRHHRARRPRPGRSSCTRRSAQARAKLGLGRSFQDGRLFPALTVQRDDRGRARAPASRCATRSPPRSTSRRSIDSEARPSATGRRAHRAHGPRRVPRQVRPRAVDREPAHRRPRLRPRPPPDRAAARRAVVRHRPARGRGARAAAAAHPRRRSARACSSSSTTCRCSRRSPTG